jgi:hypothetical protein
VELTLTLAASDRPVSPALTGPNAFSGQTQAKARAMFSWPFGPYEVIRPKWRSTPTTDAQRLLKPKFRT